VERKGEREEGIKRKEGRKDSVLTGTMCASGSVLTVKNTTEETAGQHIKNVMHAILIIISSFWYKDNN